MPIPKCLQFLPCFPKSKSPDITDRDKNVTNESGDDGEILFSRKQISRAVAIVLTGFDLELAAASVGSGCNPEIVEVWVFRYRPPFFEDGMRCPPALIDWWMQELERKEEAYQKSMLVSVDVVC